MRRVAGKTSTERLSKGEIVLVTNHISDFSENGLFCPMKVMPRRISSAFTEFYKVYGILIVLLFVPIIGLPFFNPFDFSFTIGLLVVIIFNLFFVFDFWRMKDVELTDAGLIITQRFFFTQKTVFVPFEQIKVVKNKLRWGLTKKRIFVEFNEPNGFGKEICFLTKGYWQATHAGIFEELRLTIARHKNERQLNEPILQLNN